MFGGGLDGGLGGILPRAVDGLSQLAARLAGGTLRVGVTGLRRSGKTVFLTALLHNLLNAGRLPFLEVMAQGRFLASRLQPQPDAAVPRFDYERHLADLMGDPPRWPEATRAISEIRLALRFRTQGLIKYRLAGDSTLTLDLVDYPGEWLLDLPMLGQDFATWSAQTLDLATREPRAALARDWKAALSGVDPDAKADETLARHLAKLYTDYLQACRSGPIGLSLLQPGRFLEPGEMEGAPVLTFCPLPPPKSDWTGSLHGLMADRFEAYKDKVVRRFYREHFARLDRQVVLVDVLSALNAGAPGLDDLSRSLTATLESFRHGQAGWLSWLGGARIDRVLFAATKADHVAADQHGNLVSLLESFLADPLAGIRFTGAEVRSLALASVKATDTVLADWKGRQLACVQGTPLGRDAPAVIFPGEVPGSHLDLGPSGEGRFRFTDFRPPPGLGRDGRGLPNIRLDQVLQFLIGDRLA
ncbi:YcjX family protein [Aerophototrophica crusticola]|uniref:YcjX family protein n=1 Tax=Aerophototrophica crusticola TaxID=1709002 RepID=A0A858R313_9PROT|nr:YcjX family protein [Rhodospirillaceae bacterium B3]